MVQVAQHGEGWKGAYNVKMTATRKRPEGSPVSDTKRLVLELSDVSAGRLVWEDGSVTNYAQQSKPGLVLTSGLKKIKTLPRQNMVLKTVSLRRKWGWVNGRWTITDIL